MEARDNFEFFIDECQFNGDAEVTTFYIEKSDTFFIGKEVRTDNKKLTYYIIPFQDNSALIFLYLSDDFFDSFIENLNKYNIDGAKNAWPLLMGALENSANDNYFKPSLFKYNDMFWGLFTIIENIDITVLETEYVIGKFGNLYSYALSMLQEMNDNDISKWDMAKGYGKAGVDGWKWSRVISTALAIGGTILGIPEIGDLTDEL